MGEAVHPSIREEARLLYEQEGYSPQQIIEELEMRLSRGELAEDEVLPQNRSTINRWAKTYGWEPWRVAKRMVDARIKQDLAEGVPFAISGINDPIWHLSVLEAQRVVRFILNEQPELEDSTVRSVALQEVHETLKPGPKVLERLRPIITAHIKQRRQELLQEPVSIEEVLKEGTVRHFHSAEEAEDHWIASLDSS